MRQREVKVTLDHGERTAPHSDECELAVVSAVLTDGGSVLDRLEGLLTPEEYYGDALGRIYGVCRDLHVKGQAVDLTTVAAELQARDRLQFVGGITYLARVVDTTPVVAHVEEYAARIRDLARRRELISTLAVLAAEGYDRTETTDAYADRCESRVLAAAESRVRADTTVQAYDAILGFVRSLEKGRAGHPEDAGKPLPTGIGALDELLNGGPRPGELAIVAARPGMGKSAIAIGALLAASCGAEALGSLMFSLEMPEAQCTQRLVAALADVSSADLSLVKGGRKVLHDAAWERIMAAADAVSKAPIFIDDAPAASLAEVRAKSRRVANRLERAGRRLGLVVVDYLQLMRGAGHEASREQEIGDISRGLKSLSKELKCPVIALSQLNRKCEDRTDKRPQMSDLRDSGSIEQDADVILFPFRPSRYDEHVPVTAADITVEKHRNGSTGRVPCTFRPESMRFVDATEDERRAFGEATSRKRASSSGGFEGRRFQ